MGMKLKILFFLFLILSNTTFILAQCAMCRAIPSSNQENGGSIAQGLNTGILYLMAVPYILIVIAIGYFFRTQLKQFYSEVFLSKKNL